MDEDQDYYEFCIDCANRGVEHVCMDCDAGDCFEPISSLQSPRRVIPLKEAA